MGTMNDGLKKKSAGKRGETNVGNRLAGLGGNGSEAGAADWGDAHPDNLVAVVLGVTRLGGAVSFGLSRDKGAFNVTIFLDGEKRTIWVSSSEDVDAALVKIAVHMDGIS